jgi:hypothetical protein
MKNVPVLFGKHAFLQRDLREFFFLGEGNFILKGVSGRWKSLLVQNFVCCMECAESP